MPLILGAQSSTAAAGYSVDNSCRFYYGDSGSLTRAQTTPTDADKWTLSWWFKRASLSGEMGTESNHRVFCALNTSPTRDANFQFMPDDTLRYDLSTHATVGTMDTDRIFRDTTAWYHFVLIYDSGNVTEGDRMQIWVNGLRLTNFSAETQPTQDVDSPGFNESGTDMFIGHRPTTDNQKIDGYMADAIFLDGVSDSPVDTLGEFDGDSPSIWKPIDPSGLAFGNNGWWLDFKDSANLGNDANGGTDFTVANLTAADQSQDSPTNNFTVLNPLNLCVSNQPTFSEGNTYSITNSSGTSNLGGVNTILLIKGKWYIEAEMIWGGTQAASRNGIGITGTQEVIIDSNRWAQTGNGPQATYESNNGEWQYDLGAGAGAQATSGYSSGYTGGQIVGIYLDLDNNLVYAAVDGVIGDSGTGLAITAPASTPLGGYYFGCSDSTSTSTTATWAWNFGNGCFANTVVTSSNADPNGYGLFEYSPNDGGSASFDSSAKDFYAICTKNLAEFG